MIDYNIHCSSSNDTNCVNCQYTDKCIFILDYDEEFDKYTRILQDHLRMKNEEQEYIDINHRFLDDKSLHEEHKENVRNNIRITAPVLTHDRNYFFLMYVEGIPNNIPIVYPATYVLVYSVDGVDEYRSIESKLTPHEIMEKGCECEDYEMLRKLILNRSFYSDPDDILEKLFDNLENNCILENKNITEGLLKKLLDEYSDLSFKKKRLRIRREVRQSEKRIREFQEIIDEAGSKVFEIEKKLRKKALNRLKEQKTTNKTSKPVKRKVRRKMKQRRRVAT